MTQQDQAQPSHEKSSDYVDNSAITMKDKAMLMKDESLKSLDIHVTTKHDVVTLTRIVNNITESGHARNIAKNVEGAKMFGKLVFCNDNFNLHDLKEYA